eukprot:6569662-Ditylum_brightwellii.AAC.2
MFGISFQIKNCNPPCHAHDLLQFSHDLTGEVVVSNGNKRKVVVVTEFPAYTCSCTHHVMSLCNMH